MMKPNIKEYTREFYRRNKLLFFISTIQTLFLTAANLLISWLMQQIIDLVGGYDIGFTFRQILLLAIISLGVIALSVGAAYLSRPRFTARAIMQYKEHVFSKISKKSISAFSQESTALYTSALSNDITAIEKGYLENIFKIIDQSALLIGALALMFYYNVTLTILSIFLALVPLLASVLTGALLPKAEKELSDKNASYMSMLADSLSGFSVIKTFKAEARICRLFVQKLSDTAHAKKKRQQAHILVEGIGTIAGCILQFGIMLIGAYLAIKKQSISAGSVLVFVQLLNYVLNPISVIPAALAERRAARALIERTASALEENIREEGKCKSTEISDITLSSLSFAYEKGKPILKNIDFKFERDKSYCIVGASGSGKSTLLSLIAGAHAEYSGSLRCGGLEIRDISEESLYSAVSLIQQNVFLFNASIRENITMFSDFSDKDVERAVTLSGLSELITEKGEDYLCGENGSLLSGGEKQRISIARSLLKHSRILLVDEATASLDRETAYRISDAILSLGGVTKIAVTHTLEPSLLSRYDTILALKDGSLIESGSFDTLMEKKGYFYSLYTISQ